MSLLEIDALLGSEGSPGLASLLQPYSPPDEPVKPTNAEEDLPLLVSSS